MLFCTTTTNYDNKNSKSNDNSNINITNNNYKKNNDDYIHSAVARGTLNKYYLISTLIFCSTKCFYNGFTDFSRLPCRTFKQFY